MGQKAKYLYRSQEIVGIHIKFFLKFCKIQAIVLEMPYR